MMKLIVALLLNAPLALGSTTKQRILPESILDRGPYFHRLAVMTFGAIRLHGAVDLRTRKDCISLLRATETRMGRELTKEEVARLIPSVLDGLKVKPTPPVAAEDEMHEGVIAATQILMLDDSKYIGSIKPGDEVISYDVNTKKLIANKVVGFRGGIAPSTLSILHHRVPLEPPLTVGSKQKLFSPRASAFLPYGALSKWDELLFVTEYIFPLACGTSSANREETPVYQLELESEPHNFFAEGVLVQSYIAPRGRE
jgi:hypothetical protein